MNTIQQLRSITACAFTTAFKSTTFNIALGLAVSASLLCEQLAAFEPAGPDVSTVMSAVAVVI